MDTECECPICFEPSHVMFRCNACNNDSMCETCYIRMAYSQDSETPKCVACPFCRHVQYTFMSTQVEPPTTPVTMNIEAESDPEHVIPEVRRICCDVDATTRDKCKVACMIGTCSTAILLDILFCIVHVA